MRGPGPTIGKVMRAAGWNAAGFKSRRLPRRDEGGFGDSTIRSLDLQSSGEEGDNDFILHPVGLSWSILRRVLY